jgi:glutamate transport system substrate-binding protein
MTRRTRWIPAVLVSLALLAGACGDDKKDSSTATTSAKPTFAAGSTMAALQAKGKIVVGTKFDQPGFGLRNPTTGDVEGFDVQIAKLIGKAIFGSSFSAANIQFVESVSANRETYISNGTVDIVAATYTINDARKAIVGFAGPYFVAKQDIMVKTADSTVTGVTDLNGKKVCTVKGSTSEKNVRAQAPTADVTLFTTYSQCAEALTDGRVVAVTTDNTILAGLVKTSNGAFKLVGKPFSDEPYGIGLKKGDEAFRTFLNTTLEKIFKNGDWAKAFASTLGALGLSTPTPPKVDRYDASAVPAATTVAGASTTASGGASTTVTTAAKSTSTTY